MEEQVKSQETESRFRQYQSQLLPYAYNILGDSMEAEDVVQEILSNFFLTPSDHIQNPHGYLIRSVINRSINEKKKLQVRNANYRGQWLPTPVSTEEGIYKLTDRNRILHYSLLVLLERLTPKERAVFIMKESFDFSHAEIAEMLDVSIDNSRQLYKRARQKLEPEISKSFTAKNKSDSILRELTEAILQADVEKVKYLLSEDVKTISDGGPHVSAARKVIEGKENVYKLLRAIYGKYLPDGSETEMSSFNHMPAILFKLQGTVYRCIVFELQNNRIERMFIVVNPDKLRGIMGR